MVEEMSAKERASYLARQCHGREEEHGREEDGVKEELVNQEREDKNPKRSVLFLMKGGGGRKGVEEGAGADKVLVCAPPHSAAKAVFQLINQQVLMLQSSPEVDDYVFFSAQVDVDLKKLTLDKDLLTFPTRWGRLVSVAREARLRVVNQSTMITESTMKIQVTQSAMIGKEASTLLTYC